MATTRKSRPSVLVVFGLALGVVAGTGGCAIQYSWGPFGGGPRSVPSPTGQPPVCTHRRQVLDPVCYGYQPTRWMTWPDTCPLCPPPDSLPDDLQPQIAPERPPESVPLPTLPTAPYDAIPAPPSPAKSKKSSEPAPLPPEPMPSTQPGPLGAPPSPIPLNGLNGADKPQQKHNGKDSSAGQSQRNGLPQKVTPDKPFHPDTSTKPGKPTDSNIPSEPEKPSGQPSPSPSREEPIPPKPPTPQTLDQSRPRARGASDGLATTSGMAGNVTSSQGPTVSHGVQARTGNAAVDITQLTTAATYNTGANAGAIRQSAQRGATDIAVRLTLGNPSATSALVAQTKDAARPSSPPGQTDSRSAHDRAASSAPDKALLQNVAQPKPSAHGADSAKGHDVQAASSRVVATTKSKTSGISANGVQASSVQRSAAGPTAAISATEGKTAAGPAERNPNLPTLSERLAQQAAQTRLRESPGSLVPVAGQGHGVGQSGAVAHLGRRPVRGQLVYNQPTSMPSVAAPLPPPLRTLGESSPATGPSANPAADSKVAAVNPALLLLGYKAAEK